MTVEEHSEQAGQGSQPTTYTRLRASLPLFLSLSSHHTPPASSYRRAGTKTLHQDQNQHTYMMIPGTTQHRPTGL